MNTQLEAIQMLIRMNREAQRELAKVEQTTSADFVHIDKVQESLNEQFHILLQQKEELEANLGAIEPHEKRFQSYAPIPSADTTTERRGRGAVRQYYLKDEESKPLFTAHICRIFIDYYSCGKTFTLPDGTKVKAHLFLACLYDLGIKLGITSTDAPVKDFCDMIAEVACSCPNAKDFNTAYNTIQKATKRWNPFTGKDASQLYCTTVRLHKISPSTVPVAHQKDYDEWMKLYSQVEEIYQCTKEA